MPRSRQAAALALTVWATREGRGRVQAGVSLTPAWATAAAVATGGMGRAAAGGPPPGGGGRGGRQDYHYLRGGLRRGRGPGGVGRGQRGGTRRGGRQHLRLGDRPSG